MSRLIKSAQAVKHMHMVAVGSCCLQVPCAFKAHAKLKLELL